MKKRNDDLFQGLAIAISLISLILAVVNLIMTIKYIRPATPKIDVDDDWDFSIEDEEVDGDAYNDILSI